MQIPAEILQLAAMLDDPDNNAGINLLAQLLARESELGELPALLQEDPNPLVRRRAHMLQNAIAMRQRRRVFYEMISGIREVNVFEALILLHLLWFDRDQPEEIGREVQKFLDMAAKNPLKSLEDAELFMRKLCMMPDKETTVRPESYCIGTALFHRWGATSLMMAVVYGLLADEKEFHVVQIAGEFGVADSKGNCLMGNGAWKLMNLPGGTAAEFPIQHLLRYLAATLLSCAVNSDSYRYVMSITQALTGDESENVFNEFPFPYCSSREEN